MPESSPASPVSAPDLLLALDNGTQSVRALLFDAAGRRLGRCAVPLHYHRSATHRPDADSCELAPEQFWSAAVQAIQGLLRQNPDWQQRLAALAVTTQRATVIALDKENQPVHPALIWMDQRRASPLPAWPAPWGGLFRLAGVRPLVDDFARQSEARWLAENAPQGWARVRRYGLLSAWLHLKLTGEWVDSHANQVGYLPFDFRRQDWAPTQRWHPESWKWAACPVDAGWLPRLVSPTDKLGEISREAAAQTGLPIGLPVFAAAADKACEVLGSGCIDPSLASLSYGTTATVNLASPRYLTPAPFIPPYPAALSGHYTAEFQIYRGYWLVSWFREQFGHPEQALAADAGGVPEQYFDQLALAVPPGADGLILQPYWSPGLRDPGPEARGAVIGWRDGHTRAHLYRAILEGIAYGLRQGLENICRRHHLQPQALRVSGGGAQSDAALQLTADLFNRPAERPAETETSGLGAAMCAALGLGWYRDGADAVAGMVRVGQRFEPDAATAARYDALYREVYLPLYQRLKPVYQALAKI